MFCAIFIFQTRSNSQTADQLNLKTSEVEGAINKMQQLGKIVVTEIPAKSIIEFVD
mgnify:CR=1 FL=1